jgi:hypothetical protein
MLPRKVVATLTVMTWLLFVATVHVLLQQLAQGQPQRVKTAIAKVELPAAIKYIGAPILGAGYVSSGSEDWLWYFARAFVLAPPLILVVYAWTTSNARGFDIVWSYGLAAYGAIVALLFGVLALTVLLPMRCC